MIFVFEGVAAVVLLAVAASVDKAEVMRMIVLTKVPTVERSFVTYRWTRQEACSRWTLFVVSSRSETGDPREIETEYVEVMDLQ